MQLIEVGSVGVGGQDTANTGARPVCAGGGGGARSLPIASAGGATGRTGSTGPRRRAKRWRLEHRWIARLGGDGGLCCDWHGTVRLWRANDQGRRDTPTSRAASSRCRLRRRKRRSRPQQPQQGGDAAARIPGDANASIDSTARSAGVIVGGLAAAAASVVGTGEPIPARRAKRGQTDVGVGYPLRSTADRTANTHRFHLEGRVKARTDEGGERMAKAFLKHYFRPPSSLSPLHDGADAADSPSTARHSSSAIECTPVCNPRSAGCGLEQPGRDVEVADEDHAFADGGPSTCAGAPANSTIADCRSCGLGSGSMQSPRRRSTGEARSRLPARHRRTRRQQLLANALGEVGVSAASVDEQNAAIVDVFPQRLEVEVRQNPRTTHR